MLLGYNTNGFAHHRLEDTLRILSGLGYESVAITVDHYALNPYAADPMTSITQMAGLLSELRLRHVLETGARYLLDPLHKHAPTLVSETEADRLRRVDFYQRVIDMAACLESDAVSLWSGSPSSEQSEYDSWTYLLNGLQQVLDYAATRGVRVAFEPEPGMFIDTMQRFAELQDRLQRPDLWLTLDVGHLHCLGEQPIPPWIHEYRDRLVNVHLEDMRQGLHEHLRLGQGEMDFPPILQALRDVDYGGGVHVELSRHSHLAPLVAAESWRALEGWLNEIK